MYITYSISIEPLMKDFFTSSWFTTHPLEFANSVAARTVLKSITKAYTSDDTDAC